MSFQKITARGEVFKVPQVSGNLFVCAEENGGCCCGHTEKGRAPVNKDLYGALWESHRLRNKVHLTFVGCLGPCPLGNIAMLQIVGQSIWFKDLNDDGLLPLLFTYIDAVLTAGHALPPSGELAAHVFERYLPAPAAASEFTPAIAPDTATEADFDGIDPVCMMSVDPATAQWHTEHNGTTYYFCAPACKRAFDKDPAAYVKTTATHNPTGVHPMTNETNTPTTTSKTFSVPAISCAHCVRSITNEVSEIAGVTAVQADEHSKIVTVAWNAPASWEQIKATLTEIEYPPQELIQL
jgi:YHS domain-containing protein/copper chaperone CopZ